MKHISKAVLLTEIADNRDICYKIALTLVQMTTKCRTTYCTFGPDGVGCFDYEEVDLYGEDVDICCGCKNSLVLSNGVDGPTKWIYSCGWIPYEPCTCEYDVSYSSVKISAAIGKRISLQEPLRVGRYLSRMLCRRCDAFPVYIYADVQYEMRYLTYGTDTHGDSIERWAVVRICKKIAI